MKLSKIKKVSRKKPVVIELTYYETDLGDISDAEEYYADDCCLEVKISQKVEFYLGVVTLSRMLHFKGLECPIELIAFADLNGVSVEYNNYIANEIYQNNVYYGDCLESQINYIEKDARRFYETYNK